MRVIGMDTSYKYLNICLLDGDVVVDSLHMECFKQQSEWMIPKLKELMDRHGWVSEDIEAMVITEGPGSYTGIRIAMTVAKVFCSSMNIPYKEQYCIGTWNTMFINQGKLEVVKQKMARVNVTILGISKLKWTEMGEFNSDDHEL